MSDTTLAPVQFSTGFAKLPDIGALEYNNVTFSSLFASNLSWRCEQDNAKRTVKYVEITIEAAGIVTLGGNQTTIDLTMQTLRQRLRADGGVLLFTGRGFGSNMVINGPGPNALRDVNWGPKTETLQFQPLGGGLSAMVHWRVTTWLPEIAAGGAGVLQFNNECQIGFDEEFYCNLSIRGTLEIGLTRSTVRTRTLATTVDQLREQWLTNIGNSIDLNRFRVSRRNFQVSRDRRVLEWEFSADELPPTVMPFGAPAAHGTFRFQPIQKGNGHFKWLCSLRCTYTIDKRYPRRTAWFHFMVMLWFRMQHSRIFGLGTIGGGDAVQPTAAQRARAQALLRRINVPALSPNQITAQSQSILRDLAQRTQAASVGTKPTALLIHVSGDEGLYLDAKTVSFEAQWQLFVTLDHILLASGFQRYQNMQAPAGNEPNLVNYDNLNNPWATTMRDIAGWRSWLSENVNPAGDLIIDFGSAGPSG